MKLSSLFKGKAYAFGQAGNPEDDCKFASALLKKIDPSFKVKAIEMLSVEDHCDVFMVCDKKNKIFKFKVSLSDPDKLLEKESIALKSLSGPTFPKLVSAGSEKLGEEVYYTLTEVLRSESIRAMGRSSLILNFEDFCKNYKNLHTKKSVDRSYESILKNFLNQLIPENCLPKETIDAIKGYTDYDLCRKFLVDLQKETLVILNHVKGEFNYICHGDLSIDSVFYNNDYFQLDNFYNLSMGHPYADFCSLIIDSGNPAENDIRFWRKFCETCEIEEERSLYNNIYQLELRKKLADLLISYIREIYLYDAYRYDKILEIADTFSHAYERFCKIPLFQKERKFIMKMICEPVFGVKA
tara:strand:- start:121 stop:1185 length:1065 start_codon:yes stop_codon:yes gene_type:complete